MKTLLILCTFLWSNALAQTGSGAGITQFVRDNRIQNVIEDTNNASNTRALPVNVTSGTISATNPSVGPNESPTPAQTTQVGGASPTDTLVPINITADGAVKTDSSATTQPISAVSLPLPTGAATSAKQPALGAAGTPSSDVITVQGVTGMTALKVDASETVQPVKPGPTTGADFNFTALGQNAELSDLDGQDTWTIYVSAVGAGGSMVVFGSPDPNAVAFQSVPAVNVRTGETSITISDVGLYRVNISGFFKVRLEVTAYGSGPITGIQLVSYNSGAISLNSPLPNGSNAIGSVTISQGGNAATVSGAGALKVDGSATTQPVSGTVTANAGTGTFAVSAASLPLPSGAATESTLSSVDTQATSINNKLPGALGQNTMDNSLAVVIASDQSAVSTKAPVNASGSGSSAGATVSTVITINAPSNAVGFVLQNMDTSTANIRWAIGRTATTTLGQQLQPGRDTGFVPCGANVSLVAESGTQTYDIQWISQ